MEAAENFLGRQDCHTSAQRLEGHFRIFSIFVFTGQDEVFGYYQIPEKHWH